MSNYGQNQAYPPPDTAAEGTYMAPPPPAGYPVKDGEQFPSQSQAPVEATTQSKGDGFWKGCCAALCCCCVLESCF